jgi:ribosomal protein S18 acetylase RimI-like enzyme
MLTLAYPKTVNLKDGRSVTLRPLTRDDFDDLLSFYRRLPAVDRLFLRHDVSNPNIIRRWTRELDLARVIPILALEGETIVGNGSLHIMAHGWTRHVGHLRLVTATTHRRVWLSRILARELVSLAHEHNLEKIQAQVIADDARAIRVLGSLGFEVCAQLEGMVKDQVGASHDLLIMVNDVSSLRHTIESWLQRSMIASHRVPGDGA